MITIFTPTYNRAYTLPKLFESLEAQTSNNFEWLIVDDGSSDGTRELVEHFTTKADFKITYIYQENQGKHVAINTALDKVSTLYFFTVDSDDYLKDNAIELILKKLETIENSKNIIGIASPIEMIDNEGQIVASNINLQYEIMASLNEMAYKNKVIGEFSLILKTSVAKKYPYPVFSNEKFIVESVVSNRMDNNLKLLHITSSLVVGEYRIDGLTTQIKKILVNSPKGASLAYSEKMNNVSIPIVNRKLFTINYWDYESLNNSNFFFKLKKIKSLRLKIYLLSYFISRIFKKYTSIK